jgi:hypothetical protein
VVFYHLLHLPVSRKTERDDSEAFLGGRVASGSPTGKASAKPSRKDNPLSRETLPRGGSEMTRIRCAENIVFFCFIIFDLFEILQLSAFNVMLR